MKKITFKEYKDEVKKQYEIAKREDVSGILYNPSPAQLRNFCILIFDNKLSHYDERIFRIFFETKPDEELKKSIERCNIDKFRPVISFLKGEKDSDNPTRIELSAVLVDYNPRPYSNFLVKYPFEESPKEFFKPLSFLKSEQLVESGIAVVGQNESVVRNKKSLLVIILVVLGLFSIGYVVKDVLFPRKDCMQWQKDHYELVDCKCETDGFLFQSQIKPIDFKEVTLRRIEVDEHTSFFRNGKPVIWYCKINSDSIEFYNNHGFHPLNLRPLKPVTNYIINKYVKKN